MERERKIKILSLVTLIVAVLGLTVAFAALSQNLTINGSAKVDAASWDIHFENIETNTVGYATINDTPIVNGTSINNFDVTIKGPGDQANFVVDIVNKGTINAKIGSVDISPLCTLSSSVDACDWNNDGVVTQDDINKINSNITFAMIDGNDSNSLRVGDVLNAGDTRTIAVAVLYDKVVMNDGQLEDIVGATELPKRNLIFDDLSITINYVQAD